MNQLCAFNARGWLRALVLLAVLCFASVATAQDKISDEAKLYFRNGVELIQANPPNYQDAYYQFKLAYEKSGSWKVLGNLGLCAFKLERDGEAVQAYADYLKGGGKQIDTEERKAMERDSLLISGNSAVVNLSSDVGDASILDSRAGSSVPPQTYKLTAGTLSLRFRAGTHAVTASTPDGKQLKWDITITPGETLEHRFEFTAAPAVAPVPVGPAATPEAAPPPGPLPPAPPEDAPKQGGSTLRTVGFITLGVGGAAIIGGVVTGLMAKSAESKGTDACKDKVCPTAAEGDFDSASSLATVTNVLFIGGGVLAATGVTLVLVGGKSSAQEPPKAATFKRLEVSPLVGAGVGGLVASGAF